MDKRKILEMLSDLTHEMFSEANKLMDGSMAEKDPVDAMCMNEKAGGVLWAAEKILELRTAIREADE